MTDPSAADFFGKLRSGGRRSWRLARFLARAARAHPLTGLLWATALTSAFFLAFPGADIWFSKLFYQGPAAGFAAGNDPLLIRLRGLGPFLVWLIALGSGAILLAKLVNPDRPPPVALRAPVFLLTTLILGPGVMVNAVLKNQSGRPRPRLIEAFGGDLTYEPVWRFTHQCASNCSFVSGEGSAAAWLIALVMVLPLAWRRPAAFVAVTLGLMISLNRIAFGGHFLSDTILAWCLTGLLVLIVYRLFYRHTPAWLSDANLNAGLGTLGRRLHEIVARTIFKLREMWRARRR